MCVTLSKTTCNTSMVLSNKIDKDLKSGQMALVGNTVCFSLYNYGVLGLSNKHNVVNNMLTC